MYTMIKDVERLVCIPPAELGEDIDSIVDKLTWETYGGRLGEDKSFTVLIQNVRPEGPGRIVHGNIELDAYSRNAYIDGRTIDLTAKEYDLVELMMNNPDRVYSRENLLNVVWGYEYPGDIRTVDVHIRRLREKLERDPARPEHIMTKWGVGYYFKA